MEVLEKIGSRGFEIQAMLELVCLLLNKKQALRDIEGLEWAYQEFGELSRDEVPSTDWFDPMESTSADVAEHFLIPASAKKMCAFQHIMMKGKKCDPQAILSHTWSNNFTHSVAACVADALGESYYFPIAARLRDYDEVQHLIKELIKEGKATKTYWMCLVSINQHTIMCHEKGCKCKKAKNVDRTDPTCEIGHFHEMMRVLHGKDSNFYQVICIDVKAVVLDRIWVAAEVGEVHQSGLPQRIKFHVPLNLADIGIQTKMRGLKVERCKATDPADVAMILDLIRENQGYKDYNKRVRRALSEGSTDWRGGVVFGFKMLLPGVCILVSVVLFTVALGIDHKYGCQLTSDWFGPKMSQESDGSHTCINGGRCCWVVALLISLLAVLFMVAYIVIMFRMMLSQARTAFIRDELMRARRRSDRLAERLTDELRLYGERLTEEIRTALDPAEGLREVTAEASCSAVLSKQMQEVMWPGLIACATWVLAHGLDHGLEKDAWIVFSWSVRAPLIVAFILFLLGQAHNCSSSSAHSYNRNAMRYLLLAVVLIPLIAPLIALELSFVHFVKDFFLDILDG
jgi:hypothetical protein